MRKGRKKRWNVGDMSFLVLKETWTDFQEEEKHTTFLETSKHTWALGSDRYAGLNGHLQAVWLGQVTVSSWAMIKGIQERQLKQPLATYLKMNDQKLLIFLAPSSVSLHASGSRNPDLCEEMLAFLVQPKPENRQEGAFILDSPTQHRSPSCDILSPKRDWESKSIYI